MIIHFALLFFLFADLVIDPRNRETHPWPLITPPPFGSANFPEKLPSSSNANDSGIRSPRKTRNNKADGKSSRQIERTECKLDPRNTRHFATPDIFQT